MQRLTFLIKIYLKSIPGALYQLLQPLLVYPPQVFYRGGLYTIPRRDIMLFLESWKERIHGRVLDVGVGSWTFPRQLLTDRCEYIATDCFEHPNIDVVSDIQSLEKVFDPHSFDFVICTEVLEHIPRPWIAVQQLYFVLKPGGTLLLTTPFNFHLHGNETVKDYWRLTGDGLRLLLIEEAGFREAEITPVGHPEFPFNHLVVAHK